MSAPSPIRTLCPQCRRRQTVDRAEIGQAVICLACGFRYPVADVTPAAVAPPTMPVDDRPSSRFGWLVAAAFLIVVVTAATTAVVVRSIGSPPVVQSSSSSTPSVTRPAAVVIAPTPRPRPTTAKVTPVDPQTKPVEIAVIPPVPVVRPHVDEVPQVVDPPKPPRPPIEPVVPVNPFGRDLDDDIGKSLHAGIDYLIGRFRDGRLRTETGNPGIDAGTDALCVYALLQAGEATADPRLASGAPLTSQLLKVLTALPMDGRPSTYGRALRAAALAVYNRPAEKGALKADARWLIEDSTAGTFTYDPPRLARARPINLGRRPTFDTPWDNSNCQYGALGIWAAGEAGVEIPSTFWPQVRDHWNRTQLPDGQWPYSGFRGAGGLSMTVAGITTLLVADDQTSMRAVISTLGHPPYTPQVAKGLSWLETDNRCVDLPTVYHGYNLYGLERAALASGLKRFGAHDWYRELAIEEIRNQRADGSWSGDTDVDTAYTLLFLSRGRHPIFFNKLKYDGFWSNRPRDVANLTVYAGRQLERPLNWQVVDVDSDWTDWVDCPVLYISGHEPLKFDDTAVAKLRAYARHGGLIFTHADGGTAEFTASVADLSKRLFPDYPLQDLPPGHPIYSTLYKITDPPKLSGVSNGSRLLLVHCPVDLNRAWQLRDWTQRPDSFRTAVDLFLYAAGKADLRNKLKSSYLPEPAVTPVATIGLARVKHAGDWNPEPAAAERFARWFLSTTSIRLNVTDVDGADLDVEQTPVALLTGTAALQLSHAQQQAIGDFVRRGGVLLIDGCGGSAPFADSVPGQIEPAFSGKLLKQLPAGDFSLKVRPYQADKTGRATSPLEGLDAGLGRVVFSPVDVTTGLLGTSTYPVAGYDPAAATDIARWCVNEAILRLNERR